MNRITTKDGAQFFYKYWEPDNRLSSVRAGRYRQTPGTANYSFFRGTAAARLRTIAGDIDAGVPDLLRAGLPHLLRTRRRPFGATMLHDRHGVGRRQGGDDGRIPALRLN